METKKEINILLLGETGVGKSTFINAFSNFINFDTLKQAEESNQIPILIGTKFANLDDEFNETIIQAKDDSNERKIFGLKINQVFLGSTAQFVIALKRIISVFLQRIG